MKHTPGPWWAHFNGHYFDIFPDGSQPGPERKYRGAVASCMEAEHIDGITREEQAANAQAIALVPAMIDALVLAQQALANAHTYGGGAAIEAVDAVLELLARAPIEGLESEKRA